MANHKYTFFCYKELLMLGAPVSVTVFADDEPAAEAKAKKIFGYAAVWLQSIEECEDRQPRDRVGNGRADDLLKGVE